MYINKLLFYCQFYFRLEMQIAIIIKRNRCIMNCDADRVTLTKIIKNMIIRSYS